MVVKLFEFRTDTNLEYEYLKKKNLIFYLLYRLKNKGIFGVTVPIQIKTFLDLKKYLKYFLAAFGTRY